LATKPTPDELGAITPPLVLPYDLTVDEDLPKGTKAEGDNVIGPDDWEKAFMWLDSHGFTINRRT